MEYSVKVDWARHREEASTAAGSAPSTQVDEDEAHAFGRSLPSSPAHSRGSPAGAGVLGLGPIGSPATGALGGPGYPLPAVGPYAPVAGKTLPDHMVPAVLALMASTLQQAAALGGFDPKAHVAATEEAKLFVGGLPETVSDAQVRSVFGQCGALKSLHVMRGGSDSGQACSFLCYWDRYSADLAIQALHKTPWPWAPEATIIVRNADGAEKKQRRPDPRPLRQDARPAGGKLFVGGLPLCATEEEVRAVFQPCGGLQEVHLMRGKAQSGQVCAFVQFYDEPSALRAVQALHQRPWPSAPGAPPVSVRFADRKEAPAAPQDAAPVKEAPAAPAFAAADFPTLGAKPKALAPEDFPTLGAPARPRTAGVWS